MESLSSKGASRVDSRPTHISKMNSFSSKVSTAAFTSATSTPNGLIYDNFLDVCHLFKARHTRSATGNIRPQTGKVNPSHTSGIWIHRERPEFLMEENRRIVEAITKARSKSNRGFPDVSQITTNLANRLVLLRSAVDGHRSKSDERIVSLLIEPFSHMGVGFSNLNELKTKDQLARLILQSKGLKPLTIESTFSAQKPKNTRLKLSNMYETKSSLGNGGQKSKRNFLKKSSAQSSSYPNKSYKYFNSNCMQSIESSDLINHQIGLLASPNRNSSAMQGQTSLSYIPTTQKRQTPYSKGQTQNQLQSNQPKGINQKNKEKRQEGRNKRLSSKGDSADFYVRQESQNRLGHKKGLGSKKKQDFNGSNKRSTFLHEKQNRDQKSKAEGALDLRATMIVGKHSQNNQQESSDSQMDEENKFFIKNNGPGRTGIRNSMNTPSFLGGKVGLKRRFRIGDIKQKCCIPKRRDMDEDDTVSFSEEEDTAFIPNVQSGRRRKGKRGALPNKSLFQAKQSAGDCQEVEFMTGKTNVFKYLEELRRNIDSQECTEQYARRDNFAAYGNGEEACDGNNFVSFLYTIESGERQLIQNNRRWNNNLLLDRLKAKMVSEDFGLEIVQTDI